MRNKLFRLAASTIVAGVMASIVVTATPQAALADALPTETFDSFDAGTLVAPAGSGWQYTGGTSFDVGVVEDGITGKSVRISNRVMTGSFGDWLFSKPLAAPATENGLQEFTAEFDIASAKPNQVQDDLQITVAPQTGFGARMSNLKFVDTLDGIEVRFSDVMNQDQVVGYYPAEEDWRSNMLIDTLDRATPHHVKIVLDLIPGEHNDVVQVYIDDMATGLVPGRVAGNAEVDGFFAPVDNQPTVNKAKAGQTIPMKWKLAAESFATSWEDYYRYNTESNAGLVDGPFDTRQVDSLIFQARCAAAGPCANADLAVDGGFLIDNVTYRSTDAPTLPITSTSVTDPGVYNNPVFTTEASAAAECGALGGMDTLESYAPPGASGLTYNATTGVWHYNVHTPKSWAGKCVEMTLDGFGESTLFRFVK